MMWVQISRGWRLRDEGTTDYLFGPFGWDTNAWVFVIEFEKEKNK